MDSSIRSRFSQTQFRPVWLSEPELRQTTDPLSGETSTDLLIVGAGFTGLWAAVQALEANPDRCVTIIEAQHVAYGASGRPGAIVSTSIMHGLSNAARLYPNDIEALESLGQANMDGLLASLQRYDIECDAHWGGELTVAIGEKSVPAIKAEYNLQQQYGHDVELLNQEQTRAQVNSPLFHGAVWAKHRCGTVHPGKLAAGLRHTALKLGAKLYEQTPLLRVHSRSDQLTVETPQGNIHARHILLATNAFAAGERRIKRRVALVRDRIIASAPLNDEQLSRIGWQNRQGIYDTRTQLNYMRLTADNRIVFGGRLTYPWGPHTPKQDLTVKPYLKLAQAFSATFPQLDDVAFDYAWSGPIGLTTRMAVHLQRYHNSRMVYVGGYSGFGVSASRFGARMGLAVLDNEPEPALQLDFARTMPGWMPPKPFRWLGGKLTMYALDTHDAKGGWRSHWLRLVERLGFPLS